MKTALLILTIGCATLLCPTAHTTTTDDANSRQKAVPTVPQERPRAPAAKSGGGSVPLPKPVIAHRAMNKPKNPFAGRTNDAHRQVSKQRNDPTNAAVSGGRNTIQPHLLRPPTLPRPATPVPNNARHHGPNPAAIGGPRNTTVSSSAALSGRMLSRRP